MKRLVAILGILAAVVAAIVCVASYIVISEDYADLEDEDFDGVGIA